MKTKSFIYFLLLALFVSCEPPVDNPANNTVRGALFIIGGGKRPPELIKEMLSLASVSKDDKILILPNASSEEDSAVYYSSLQFQKLGFENIASLPSEKISHASISEAFNGAKLIYISGGDQNKFMKTARENNFISLIREAYRNGSTIAGTSAGAAVMSQKMITGDELRYPEYTGDFRTIENENIIYGEGLGLVANAIIDQHFVKRMRMNRLISVCLENPGYCAIGIDESTAIAIKNDTATVVGTSQVIHLKNNNPESVKTHKTLIGGKDLNLNIYLPGDKFIIK